MRSNGFSTLILCCAFLSSCGDYLKKKNSEIGESQSTQNNLAFNFASMTASITSKRCISCHSQYNSYGGVLREIAAIRSAVVTNRMPKNGGPLTDRQKVDLINWIDRGAPEFDGEPSKPSLPISIEPNWKSISENILFPKCLVCHNPEGQAKFLDLSNRQAIFDSRHRIFSDGSKLLDIDNPQNSYFLNILYDVEPMPPVWSNIPQISNEEFKALSTWIAMGLP
jgi:uncharacterized membrane protein